jgi:hypothetical protein
MTIWLIKLSRSESIQFYLTLLCSSLSVPFIFSSLSSQSRYVPFQASFDVILKFYEFHVSSDSKARLNWIQLKVTVNVQIRVEISFYSQQRVYWFILRSFTRNFINTFSSVSLSAMKLIQYFHDKQELQAYSRKLSENENVWWRKKSYLNRCRVQ